MTMAVRSSANFVRLAASLVERAMGTQLRILMLAIVAGMLGRVVGGVFGIWSVVLVAVLGGLAAGQSNGGIAGVVVAVSLAVISKRAVRGDPRDRTLRRVAHRLIGR